MPASSQDLGFYGKGWAFPINASSGSLPAFTGGEEKIRQSIFMILSTVPGERQMRPDFGCRVHELLFDPNVPEFRASAQASVREALIRWEPRIDVVDVRLETAPEAANFVLIRIDYRIRANNAFHNLVYPFFINEGAG